MLAWEAEGSPDPTPFRIDRPVTVLTDIVGGDERIERPSWLLAADTEVGDSGAALIAAVEGRTTAVGVAWGASRRGGGGVAYATRGRRARRAARLVRPRPARGSARLRLTRWKRTIGPTHSKRSGR